MAWACLHPSAEPDRQSRCWCRLSPRCLQKERPGDLRAPVRAARSRARSSPSLARTVGAGAWRSAPARPEPAGPAPATWQSCARPRWSSGRSRPQARRSSHAAHRDRMAGYRAWPSLPDRDAQSQQNNGFGRDLRRRHPTRAGGAPQVGRRQSMPSQSMASCALVNRVAPSLALGHGKLPRSRTL